MAHHGGLPVVTPRRLADGGHEDLVAARSGAAPSVVASATGDDGRPRSRLWNAAPGPPAGPPVLGFVDGADGTSGMVSAENENRPALVVEPPGGMPLIDARTGE